MDDDVDAKTFEPPGALDPVLRAQVVPHYTDLEIAARVDHPPDRGLVCAPHDDDEVGPGLGHHLRLEIPAVHGFQVSHDWVAGKTRAKLLDRVETFGQEQRRARFEPVDAGLDADGCR